MMEEKFSIIKPESIEDNLFKLIGSDWMLVCAGKPDNYNMMTASWGFAGVLWRKHVAVAFIRPQRHTFGFMENNAYYSLSFFGEEHREILNLCGTVSGRDLNKMDIEGLTPLETPLGNVIFEEARLVFECRKLYYDDIKPELFQAFEIEKIYPTKDYHRFFIGEIVNVWKKNG
jgi:flavin reductase (DIM6/NTAB) family NADH-FMN oxidoreductase RutF